MFLYRRGTQIASDHGMMETLIIGATLAGSFATALALQRAVLEAWLWMINPNRGPHV